eukprot:CAMPEP_0176404056 /NCGR_PEP_ID=MMETSP0126-20121128/50569_1 /TAXON_ID=141414 ORGANISM="Strombidinopsis acuminatum, Strain SPMC142" /NCGR_SAMPLE_ID=MMETSP0126 /ASSEMBLY_ACC=CAM_ASM_000229 /LENGTH=113 /DNA_ID=CAMNT_0017782637 /DNA_START=1089 /DNA_END=1430 /DNA_ORIENTATION=-
MVNSQEDDSGNKRHLMFMHKQFYNLAVDGDEEMEEGENYLEEEEEDGADVDQSFQTVREPELSNADMDDSSGGITKEGTNNHDDTANKESSMFEQNLDRQVQGALEQREIIKR